MPSKDPAQRLVDILDNIAAIRAFTAGLTYESYARDLKTSYCGGRQRVPARVRIG